MTIKANNETTNKLVKLEPGLTVKVFQKVKETNSKGEEKERIQIFEGLIIKVKKPNSKTGTFTIRKDSSGVGVEKVLPINSPLITKIEVVKKAKVRRAKLYYTKTNNKKLKDRKITK